MTKIEFRKPVNKLIEDRTKLENTLNGLRDQHQVAVKKMSDARADQMSYQAALEELPAKASNTGAKTTLKNSAMLARQEAEEAQKEIERIEKQMIDVQNKIKGLSGAIKELQNQ